jgi:DNA-binding transcriptional MerR regulator
MGLKIGEIARRSGVPASTIRYYVKEGLLPSPSKPNRKMAYYDESCIEKLKAIGELQEKRYYPLSVIRNILRRMDDGFSFEEAEAVESAVFAPAHGGEVSFVSRSDFLKLTGLKPDQLDEAERIGLVIPVLSERGKPLYDEEDIAIARDAVHRVYALGIDPKALDFYVTLGRRIMDEEVALRRKLTRGLSSKNNAEMTAHLTQAANLFRTYILRRLFQQRIESRIQRSLSGSGTR